MNERFKIQTGVNFQSDFDELFREFGLDIHDEVWVNYITLDQFKTLAEEVQKKGAEGQSYLCSVIDTKRLDLTFNRQFIYYGLLKYLFIIIETREDLKNNTFYTYYGYLIEMERTEKVIERPIWEANIHEAEDYIRNNIAKSNISGMRARLSLLSKMQDAMVTNSNYSMTARFFTEDQKLSWIEANSISTINRISLMNRSGTINLDVLYDVATVIDDPQINVIPILLFEGVNFTKGGLDELRGLKVEDINFEEKSILIKGNPEDIKSQIDRTIVLSEKSFDIVRQAAETKTRIAWNARANDFVVSKLLPSPYLLKSASIKYFEKEDMPITFNMVSGRIRKLYDLVKNQFQIENFSSKYISNAGKIYYLDLYYKEIGDLTEAAIKALKRFGDWDYTTGGVDELQEKRMLSNYTRINRITTSWRAEQEF